MLEQRLGVAFKWEELPPKLQERLQARFDDRNLLVALQVLMEDAKEEIWASDSAVMMGAALILCFAFAGAYIFIVHRPLSESSVRLRGRCIPVAAER